jgi:hypothetical protein
MVRQRSTNDWKVSVICLTQFEMKMGIFEANRRDDQRTSFSTIEQLVELQNERIPSIPSVSNLDDDCCDYDSEVLNPDEN